MNVLVGGASYLNDDVQSLVIEVKSTLKVPFLIETVSSVEEIPDILVLNLDVLDDGEELHDIFRLEGQSFVGKQGFITLSLRSCLISSFLLALSLQFCLLFHDFLLDNLKFIVEDVVFVSDVDAHLSAEVPQESNLVVDVLECLHFLVALRKLEAKAYLSDIPDLGIEL